MGVRAVVLVYSRLVGGNGWDGVVEGWELGLVGFGQAK